VIERKIKDVAALQAAMKAAGWDPVAITFCDEAVPKVIVHVSPTAQGPVKFVTDYLEPPASGG
jgi:hypothetical protein